MIYKVVIVPIIDDDLFNDVEVYYQEGNNGRFQKEIRQAM